MEVMSNTEKCGQENNDQKKGTQSKTTVTNDNTDNNSATNKDESKDQFLYCSCFLHVLSI